MASKEYFFEQEVQAWLKEYQDTYIERNGVVVFKNEALEYKITLQVMEIVDRIISIYGFHYFEDADDLKQHAVLACFTNYLKFTPNKGSAFNYFSLIAKRSLQNYTLRRKKHRLNVDIEEQLELPAQSILHMDRFLEELGDSFVSIIEEHYTGFQKEKYLRIASIIILYLDNMQTFISKTDMYAYAKSFGFKSPEIRDFIKNMNEYRSDLLEGIQFGDE